MIGNADLAVDALNRRFVADHPSDASFHLETMPTDEAAGLLIGQSVRTILPVWRLLAPNAAAAILGVLPIQQAVDILVALSPNEALQLLGLLEEDKREELVGHLPSSVAQELRDLMIYPADTAGRIMDTRFMAFRASTRAREALRAMRKARIPMPHSLFLLDANNHLEGEVTMARLALAETNATLGSLARPAPARIDPMAPQSEVAELLERYKLLNLPVTTVDGMLVGVIRQKALIDTMQASALSDMQAMVGASREERALSSPLFTVRKRMPWLQVNLLTAFLAAGVVGLFESTIAQFTALAVLLPVVAGESGNAGAQALAVTMRGLALREISTRDWSRVVTKEVAAGFMNGVAIAVTCGIGVYLWSGSAGLVIVIVVSMILAMVMAGFAGALVPIILTKLGQDPAQSSSIVLTTITDVAGFMSFLGIATLLSGML